MKKKTNFKMQVIGKQQIEYVELCEAIMKQLKSGKWKLSDQTN